MEIEEKEMYIHSNLKAMQKGGYKKLYLRTKERERKREL